MSTLIVYAKGDVAALKVSHIALNYHSRSSIKMHSIKWYQYQPRIEARFHNLTAHEIAAVKVKLSFVEGVTKIELI